MVAILRYSHYNAVSFGHFYLGGELHGVFARPSFGGEWRFTQYDSKDKITGESQQPMTAASAPAFNSLRGLFHLGLNVPTGSWIAIEMGVMAGVGGSDAKYVVQSPFSPKQFHDRRLHRAFVSGICRLPLWYGCRFTAPVALRGSAQHVT